ncbi:MAG: Hsp20 family protein, partial [Coriobacteriia bacterium]|nr:Hsp20 family protein [Coriobacteriia bacterium]
MSYLQPSYRSPRHRGLRRMRPFRPDIFDITPRMGFYPYGFDSMMREHNRAMYHMMQDMMSQDFGDFASMMPRSFKIDVEDKETEYLVTADMPGVQKDEIDIDFHNGRLTVSVDKHYDADDNQEEQEEISAEE